MTTVGLATAGAVSTATGRTTVQPAKATAAIGASSKYAFMAAPPLANDHGARRGNVCRSGGCRRRDDRGGDDRGRRINRATAQDGSGDGGEKVMGFHESLLVHARNARCGS